MLKTYLSILFGALLCLSAVSQPVAAQQDKQPMNELIKIKIAKLGVGEKAKAAITVKDGTKINGYISRVGDDDFVVRDRKTDVATTIRYADVLKAESKRGHSTARNIAIGVGIGVGAFLAAIAIILTHLD